MIAVRLDRYNHEEPSEDTEDDTEDLMFSSFSSCTPRYSKVYSDFKELRQVSGSSAVLWLV